MGYDAADLDDGADYSEPGDDEEAEALTADIASIIAGRTVVPAAVAWWRTRRERRAERDPGPSEGTRPPRWFEI
ncbi:MAG: hypothetical protein ACLQFR_04485 [Streptosporangiaceae bacterium]